MQRQDVCFWYAVTRAPQRKIRFDKSEIEGYQELENPVTDRIRRLQRHTEYKIDHADTQNVHLQTQTRHTQFILEVWGLGFLLFCVFVLWIFPVFLAERWLCGSGPTSVWKLSTPCIPRLLSF